MIIHIQHQKKQKKIKKKLDLDELTKWRYKSEEEKSVIKNINTLYESWEKV